MLWALVLFAVAVYAVHTGGTGNVVEIGLSIASVAYGCLLGVFLLGTLTRYATQGGAIVGMVTGFALNVVLWQFPGKVIWRDTLKMPDGRTFPGPLPDITVPHIAWTWYVLIGALVTFAFGLLASVVLRSRARKAAVAAVMLLVVFASSSLNAQTSGASPTSQNRDALPSEQMRSPGTPDVGCPHSKAFSQMK